MLVEVSLTIIVLEFVHPIHVSDGGDVGGECDGVAYDDGIGISGEDQKFVLVTSMILKLTNSIRYHQFHVDVGGDVVDDGVSGEDQKTRQFDTTKVLVVTQTVSGIISPMSDTHWFRVTFVTHHHTVLPRSLWGSTSFIKT